MQTTVLMIATAEHQYAGRRLRPDEQYECEPQHVSLMERLGWARPAASADPALTYQTRALTANTRGRRK